jgi:TolB-like protein/Flp pilus assembly protein TadD
MATNGFRLDATGNSLSFGPFTLLPAEQRLLRHGADVPLGPRAFDLLCLLAQRAGQLVTKDEMLDAVWHGLVVEEANLHVQVSLLRKAIGTDAVVTVPALGYRFALPVANAPAATLLTPASPRPLRSLSVIVLPFVESGATPEQAYFADAITDDVTTQLSKIRGSYVIGNRTAQAHKGEPVDIAVLARELGVRYVLQGRLERNGQGVETNVRLSDAMTGEVVWSDSINVTKAGLSDIRHELVARLANALNLQLIAVEASRSQRDNADDPEAMDLVMQARVAAHARWSPQRYDASLRLCELALQRQPRFAPALAERARLLTARAASWSGPDCEAMIALADSDVHQALAQDPLDARCHFVLSTVRQLQFRFDAAFAALEQALELNPNDSEALAWHGFLLLCTGAAAHAPEPIHRALALSPRDPQRWSWLFWVGWSHLLNGEYAKAVAWFEKSIAVMPYWATYRNLAAACAHLGRDDEAQAALQRLAGMAQNRSDRVRNLRTGNNLTFLAQQRDHVAMGLAKAGVTDAVQRHDQWAERQRRIGLQPPDAQSHMGSFI